MFRLSRYLLAQLAPWLAIAVVGAALLFLTTQLVRVVPVFVGAGATPLELAHGLGLLLVPILGWSLTPAFVVAVFAVVGRMGADGELTALDAAGIGRLRLALAPVPAACVMVALAGWIWLDAGPRAQASLRALADELAGRAIAGQIRPGRFVEPIPGITFYADAGEAGSYQGVLVEDARPGSRRLRLLARTASVRYDPASRYLEVELGDGSAFVDGDGSGAAPAAVGFEELRIRVSATDEVTARLGFLPRLMAVPTSRLLAGPPAGSSGDNAWRFALWRRVAGPCGFAALALAATILALGGRWRSRGLAVAVAGGLFLAYHLLCRLGESLALSGSLSPVIAALGPSAVVVLLSAALGLSSPRIGRA